MCSDRILVGECLQPGHDGSYFGIRHLAEFSAAGEGSLGTRTSKHATGSNGIRFPLCPYDVLRQKIHSQCCIASNGCGFFRLGRRSRVDAG